MDRVWLRPILVGRELFSSTHHDYLEFSHAWKKEVKQRMTRGSTPYEGEKGGNTTRHRPYPSTALKDATQPLEQPDTGHKVGGVPKRAPRTPNPAQNNNDRPTEAINLEDEEMEEAPSEQTTGSPQGDRGELEPREMTLLDMTLRQAAEILKTISIHAEYTPQIRTLTESIVQRILPEMQSPAATPTIDNGKEDILQNVVRTMERLTSRIDAMESRAGRPDQAQATGRSWAEEMDETDTTPTHTTTTSRKDARKDTPNTSTATSKPITPRPRRDPLPRPAVTNPLAAYHPSRLIVEIEDGPGPQDRPTEAEIVRHINEVLQSADESRRLRVVNVKFNAHNNCIVFTRSDQSAGDLATFADNFTPFIAGDRRTRVRPDQRWYKVQLNGVPVRNERTSAVQTPQEIDDELCALNHDYARMAIMDLPRWMQHQADIQHNTHSLIVLALKTDTNATFLINRVQNLAIGGNFAQVKRYADKPPVMQCSRCWAFGHTRSRCKQKERCRICGKDDHNEATHVCTECPPAGENGDDVNMDTPAHQSHSNDYQCANCNGPHSATFRNCTARERAAGTTKSKPSRNGNPTRRREWIEVTPNTHTTTNAPSQARRRDEEAERNRFALLEAAEEAQRANDAAALEKRFPEAGKDKCKATLELADGNFQRAVAIMSDLKGPREEQDDN